MTVGLALISTLADVTMERSAGTAEGQRERVDETNEQLQQTGSGF
jgi:hypothetical protein